MIDQNGGKQDNPIQIKVIIIIIIIKKNNKTFHLK